MKICRLLLTLLVVAILGFSTLMTTSAAGPGAPDTTVKVTDEWFWYRAHPFPAVIERTIAKDEALAIIQGRLESISKRWLRERNLIPSSSS